MTNQANNGQQMGGFVEGTLVHTKEGLKPIEQIKVGDYVLSQPEMKGERAYKRVTRTFEYDDKQIYIVSYYRDDDSEQGYTVETIGVTANHPFWVVGIGWTRADHLDNTNGHQLELLDGTAITLVSSRPLIKMQQEGYAWARDVLGAPSNDMSGNKVSLQYGSITFDNERSYPDWNCYAVPPEEADYKAKVFNIEVEDFHTYYVGKFGICVHNTCAETLHVEISIAKQTLTLFDRHNVKTHYSISTAANGVGCDKNSGCTPLGAHIIRAKIGASAPVNAAFLSRRPTGEICTPELMAAFPNRDWILTRILWLSGTEIGKNRLGNVDSMQRYIYIHGTPDSEPMGVPRSHGCVRMRNVDVVELFNAVDVGTRVVIK